MASGPVERAHYAAEPFDFYPEWDYGEQGESEIKPRGFWYSAPCDGDGWEHWCRSEEWNLDSLGHKYRVAVDGARILTLRDSLAVRAFAEEFRRPQARAFEMSTIDWPEVQKRWAGIEIAPYQWSLRLEEGFMWYYGWDCSSGCVWDLSAILSVSPVAATAPLGAGLTLDADTAEPATEKT